MKRRYNDFYEFHQELLMEFWDQSIIFPELPSKSWGNIFWLKKLVEIFLIYLLLFISLFTL